MSRLNNPKRLALWNASDRYFRQPIDLSAELDLDPAGTLARLRHAPDSFAAARSSLRPNEIAKAHDRLLSAAEAYVHAARSLSETGKG